ncbi:uncharacterized protein BX663DRAFT_499295 [Cokeromyces recurvatus]|uniref:uncharacterized protein n=1 Tax=Cokeromyces recurvatus TaxID=90255 RepID=UPI002220E4E8|nr:uncharacterized protein BX663DRAFT_499295 [Cokeromyces recurvatus]KAI7906219.1 hypothetical protein BX663DRAFT_499295 [Cokeromyces recurvatus]
MKNSLIDWKAFMVSLTKQHNHVTRRFNLTCPFSDKIGETFVFNVDPETNEGLVAMIKDNLDHIGQYTVAFLKYPSYTTIAEFKLSFSIPPSWTCQIAGLQTVKQQQGERTHLFSIVLGENMPLIDDDQVFIWKVIFIYRLLDNNRIVCLGHVNIEKIFLGRQVFFFNAETMSLSWLNIVAPKHTVKYTTCYMIAFGPTLPRYASYGQIIQFDLSASDDELDPSRHHLEWNEEINEFVKPDEYSSSMSLISIVRLGSATRCLMHLRYPFQLNHLVFIGETDAISIYDWRFGIRVGIIPGTTSHSFSWGLEIAWAISPPFSCYESLERLIPYGLRLVIVDDDEFSKCCIKIWDISKLLSVKWNPFKQEVDNNQLLILSKEDELDMPYIYPWWHQGTQALKQLAIQLYQEPKKYEMLLPYTLDPNLHLLCVHQLDEKIMAFNILGTLLFTLNEKGCLKVMDIETCQIINSFNTDGLDINVIADQEVIMMTKNSEILVNKFIT